MQNDFVSGSLAVRGADAEFVRRINAFRRRLGWTAVVFTQDYHPENHCSFADMHGQEVFSEIQIPAPGEGNGSVAQVMWPRHCVQGTQGAEFHPDLERQKGDIVVRKGLDHTVDSYSGFFDNFQHHETDLRKVLAQQGITDVYCVGLAFDYCAGSTAFDAATVGFKSHVVMDLCRSVADGSHSAMVEKLKEGGVKLLSSGDVRLDGEKRQRSSTGSISRMSVVSAISAVTAATQRLAGKFRRETRGAQPHRGSTLHHL